MDTLVKYDRVIESALQGHTNVASDRDRLDYQVIVDAERENFLLMTIGWEIIAGYMFALFISKSLVTKSGFNEMALKIV
jgi:XisI protein